jgi:hypothetical protein
MTMSANPHLALIHASDHRGFRTRSRLALARRTAFVPKLIAYGLALTWLAAGGGAAAAVVFHEDFNGSLSNAWTIVRTDAGYYSLQPTGLVLRCSSGDLWAGYNTAKNVFLITNPAPGDLTMTVKLRWLVPPAANWAQFDLLAYDNDDNHVRVDYTYSSGSLGLGRIVETGGTVSQAAGVRVDFGTQWFWLQIRKAGATYSSWYSADGIAFYPATSAFSYGDGTPGRVGFVAMVDQGGEHATALIDSFTVEDAVPAHPPTLTSATSVCGRVNRPFVYQIIASEKPTGYGASGLPQGLSVDTGSGLISGTPAAAGVFTVQLGATNTAGAGTTNLVLTIDPAGPASLFFDDFSGAVDPAWDLVRPNAAFYSLQPTGLVLRCNAGDIWTYRVDALNLFLITNPAPGDFTITAKLRWLTPPAVNEAQFDLLAYDNDDNHVRLCHGHLSDVLRIDNAIEVGGAFSGHGLTPVDFGTAWFWLQMRKESSTYSAWYSLDGNTFSQASSPFTYGDGTPARLGFVAMVDSSQSAQILVDWFSVEEILPAAPRLSVALSNATLVVLWPASAEGWLLQATTNLLVSGSLWAEFAPPYSISGTNFCFTEPALVGNKFYRLHKP